LIEIKVNKKKLEATREWLRLRKKSVIAHWLYGLLCAIVAMMFFPGGIALVVIFAGFEVWNDKCDGSHEGAQDWWDSFLVFCIGFSVIVILTLCGKVSIRWH